jgi:hypothetical protein
MVKTIDIFRVDNGQPLWIESVETKELALERINELASFQPGVYIVLNQTTGLKREVHAETAHPNS